MIKWIDHYGIKIFKKRNITILLIMGDKKNSPLVIQQ